MSRPAKFMALAVIAVVALLMSIHSTKAVDGQSPSMTTWLEGNYRVLSECTFMDKTGMNGKEEQVKRIEFHPEYIVLIGQTGSGRLIPVHAIKSLRWEPS